MSDNPFRELPSDNPYASPALSASAGSSGNPLLFPAIVLLVLSSLFLVMILASLPGQIMRMRAIDTSTPRGAGELVGSIMAVAMLPLMNLVILLGAISMLRLKNYRSAYSAAILSVIPFCSPCVVLAIPFGIWALVVLNRPEVKASFHDRSKVG